MNAPRSERHKAIRRHLLIYAGLVPYVVIAVFPIYWMLITAFKRSSDITTLTPQFWPAHPSLRGFSDVLHDPIFIDDMRNSAIITLSAVLISLVIGFFGAMAIARFRFLGRKVFIFAVLIVQMIPLLASTIPPVIFSAFMLAPTGAVAAPTITFAVGVPAVMVVE